MKLDPTNLPLLPPVGALGEFDRSSSGEETWEQLPDVVAKAQTSTTQRWLAEIRQPGAVMAGVAIAATAASAAKLLIPPSQYEGSFEIAVNPVTQAPAAIPAPQVEDANQTVAMPEVNYNSQARLLESPRFLEPVLKRLQAQGMEIDFATLRRNLEVTVSENSGALEVRYRDGDRQRVQQVIDQVVQVYLQEGQQCQSEACRGLEFVNAQIPRIQQKIQTLRTDLGAFRARYNINNLEAHGRQLRVYTSEMSHQEAAMRVEMDRTRSQFRLLQERLALKPDEAIALQLLNQDPEYQQIWRQFQTVERGIADQFRSPQVSQKNLKTLYQVHQRLVMQLRQRAQVVLAQQFSGDRPPAHPVFETTVDAATLRQWFDTASLLQAFQVRQQTIDTIQSNLNQQVEQWAAIARHYTEMQQQLQVASDSLEMHLSKRQAFKTDPMASEVAWRLVSSPKIEEPRAPLEEWLARSNAAPDIAAQGG